MVASDDDSSQIPCILYFTYCKVGAPLVSAHAALTVAFQLISGQGPDERVLRHPRARISTTDSVLY